MEHRDAEWWFNLPGLTRITLGPNFSELQLRETWHSTRAALTKVPYVLLTGFSSYVSTAICFAEWIENVLAEGRKICIDVSLGPASEAMICILMSRVMTRHRQTYPNFLVQAGTTFDNQYPQHVRVQVDRTIRAGFPAPPQFWAQISDVLMNFGMLVLAASGSDDVQNAIKLAEALQGNTFSVYKIAVAAMVSGDGDAMIEIVLSTIKHQPDIPLPPDSDWLQQLHAFRSGSAAAAA